MAEEKVIRLSKAAKELNISVPRILEFLSGKGQKIDSNPNTKIPEAIHHMLMKEFQPDMFAREESEQKALTTKLRREADEMSAAKASKALEEKAKAADLLFVKEKPAEPEVIKASAGLGKKPVVLGNIDVDAIEAKEKAGKKKKLTKKEEAAEKEKEKEKAKAEKKKAKETPVAAEPEPEIPVVKEKPKDEEPFRLKRDKLEGPKVLRTIDLKDVPADTPQKRKPVASSTPGDSAGRKSRKRKDNAIGSSHQAPGTFKDNKPAPSRERGYGRTTPKVEPTTSQIQDQIRATLQRLTGGGKSKASKYRKQRREEASAVAQEAIVEKELQKNVLKVTEFVSANELSKMMNIPVTQVISSCLTLGLFVSINQRLDAETISIVAEEFGFKVEFVKVDEAEDTSQEETDTPDSLISRPPIVTVMGHVDHGKTSLLDYIRKTNVIAGEAGGITQHIGAYEVTLENKKQITFLDTPGHEAFTAMRARGAKVTDVAIIVVAADDSVMPQTIEAINHAQAANVPLVFAINKIDKPGANPEKIKERLSQMNILVEEWGGKFQCQEISAKKGTGIESLLDKVLLEAEFLELKANPNKRAIGTIIESTLDKGRGYVTTLLVQAGSLKVGDVMLAGAFSGKVKAMFNERGQKVSSAGPATPVLVLGMSGAPQAGDTFKVMDDEREAREIASKRSQLVREQGIRVHKHITLDEIGRRLAIGNFKELNIIVKGDVDGSVEALSDSMQKLSTPEIQLNVIHKSVGQISESDVLLASASNAIIIGFQVRPSLNARKLAENEQIDIRLYSIIYDAINEIKSAMEGMLAPEVQEKVVCNVEIREVFNITKVGTVAGCMVLDGKITRNTKIRIIRDGIVIHQGELASLKRFKDDVKEVVSGYECGLNIKNFDGIQPKDIIEGYELVEVKRKI